jgi:hypothetical protein
MNEKLDFLYLDQLEVSLRMLLSDCGGDYRKQVVRLIGKVNNLLANLAAGNDVPCYGDVFDAYQMRLIRDAAYQFEN